VVIFTHFYEDEGKLYVERFLKIQYWNNLQSLMGKCNLIKTGQQQLTLYLKISVHFCVHREHKKNLPNTAETHFYD